MDPAADSALSNTAGAGGGDDGRGRGSLSLSARLKVAGSEAEATVRVRNLSSGGLMAELPEPVAPDSVVQVELGGLGWLSGRVAWQVEGRAGIAFDKPIDPQLARKPVGLGNADEASQSAERHLG